MPATERDALFYRIQYMYYRLTRELKEKDAHQFTQINRQADTESFLDFRKVFFHRLDRYEARHLGDTLRSVRTTAPLNEVRSLDRILEATLEYWGISPSVLSVEALMRPHPFRGCRVEDVKPEDILEPAGEEGYWLLTRDGYLEFHGGGYLRNEYGPVSLTYDNSKSIGSRGIETGLLNIFNYASEEGEGRNNGKTETSASHPYSREEIIETMLQGGLNYYVNSGNINEQSNWYWNLKDNQDYNSNRRIKLPPKVYTFFRQFEPGWKRVENGFIGADYSEEPGAGARYHVGVDWAWRCNNRNCTVGVPVLSTTDGVVKSSKDEGGRIGNAVRITCSDGAEIDYFHLGSLLPGLKSGVAVTRGDLIGYGGGSGTEFAHLHIAKSYNDQFSANERGFYEEKCDGNEIANDSFILYQSKEYPTREYFRAYVTPPKPLEFS
ncbi:MAG: M23 family metallopeptidase [Spirochaetales bacterium]|nr:M23 family metallopeptidase [Spirochaetales bacterium]